MIKFYDRIYLCAKTCEYMENSLPEIVTHVSADTTDTFKKRINKFWINFGCTKIFLLMQTIIIIALLHCLFFVCTRWIQRHMPTPITHPCFALICGVPCVDRHQFLVFIMRLISTLRQHNRIVQPQFQRRYSLDPQLGNHELTTETKSVPINCTLTVGFRVSSFDLHIW